MEWTVCKGNQQSYDNTWHNKEGIRKFGHEHVQDILYGTYYERPHPEYGIQARSSYYKKDIQQLETVQRRLRATKMVKGHRMFDLWRKTGQIKYVQTWKKENQRRHDRNSQIIKGLENINLEQLFEDQQRN